MVRAGIGGVSKTLAPARKAWVPYPIDVSTQPKPVQLLVFVVVSRARPNIAGSIEILLRVLYPSAINA
jgi:hypothetical protein